VTIGKGRNHDFRLFKGSKVRLHPNVCLQADRGYQGIRTLHAHSQLPYKRSKKQPLSKEQRAHNRQLASERVVVEHAIRRLKVFRILSERYRNRRKRFALRAHLLAGVLNYQLNF
jgi:transposase